MKLEINLTKKRTMNFHNIIFKREDGLGGFRSTTHFKNRLKLSVSAGMGVYCTPREDLSSINQYLSFEIGIFDSDGEWVTKQFFTDHNDDVVGWLNRDDINDLMTRIASHGEKPKDIPGFEGTMDQLNNLSIR